MRTLFIIICLANIAFAFGTLPWMPEKVAVEFVNNEATGFVSPMMYAVEMSVYVIILMTIGLCSRWFAAKFWWMLLFYFILLPDGWSNKENRPQTTQRFATWIELVSVGCLLFHLPFQWLNFLVNQRVPPYLTTIESVVEILGIFILLIFLFAVLYRLFRLPKSDLPP